MICDNTMMLHKETNALCLSAFGTVRVKSNTANLMNLTQQRELFLIRWRAQYCHLCTPNVGRNGKELNGSRRFGAEAFLSSTNNGSRECGGPWNDECSPVQ